MRTTKLSYEYSDKPCNRPGVYWARIFTAESSSVPEASHHYLGKAAIQAHTVLEAAEDHAARVGSRVPHQRKAPYPIGCTIIKACGNHVEVVENAIVVPPDWEAATFTVLGTLDLDALEEDESGTARFATRVSGYPNQHGRRPIHDDDDIIDLSIMPHVTAPENPRGLEGIRIDRGGLTNPVDFCLLGDERLVSLHAPEAA